MSSPITSTEPLPRPADIEGGSTTCDGDAPGDAKDVGSAAPPSQGALPAAGGVAASQQVETTATGDPLLDTKPDQQVPGEAAGSKEASEEESKKNDDSQG